MKHFLQLASAIVLAVFPLISCGGGGGSSATTTSSSSPGSSVTPPTTPKCTASGFTQASLTTAKYVVASIDSCGNPVAASNPYGANLSSNGRFVIFPATLTSSTSTMMVRDTCAGQPSCSNVTVDLGQAGQSGAISDDGRTAAFQRITDIGSVEVVPVSARYYAGGFFAADTCMGSSSGCSPSVFFTAGCLPTCEFNGSTFSDNPQRAPNPVPKYVSSVTPDGRYFLWIASSVIYTDGIGSDGTPVVYVGLTCVAGRADCLAITGQSFAGISSPSLAMVVGHFIASDANGVSPAFTLSADGRDIAYSRFVSQAGGNARGQIFISDTCIGTGASYSIFGVESSCQGHQLCSTPPDRFGLPTCDQDTPVSDPAKNCWGPTISPDDRYVSYSCGDPTDTRVYLTDTCIGFYGAPCTPSTVEITPGLAGSGLISTNAGISSGGRYVVFTSNQRLVPEKTSTALNDAFVYDSCIGAPAGCVPTIARVSVAASGAETNNDSTALGISADGKFILFSTASSNLVSPSLAGTAPSSAGGSPSVYVYLAKNPL